MATKPGAAAAKAVLISLGVTLANHAGGALRPRVGDQAEFLHLRSNLIFVPAEEARDLRHRPAVGDFVVRSLISISDRRWPRVGLADGSARGGARRWLLGRHRGPRAHHCLHSECAATEWLRGARIVRGPELRVMAVPSAPILGRAPARVNRRKGSSAARASFRARCT